ncbi:MULTISPECIES: TAXI family TRAP transporter solute-binding subunit [unclassified Dolichospermum]|uniref:TAXI family TRAP transporter solute-binding subunit n=1 Tax=unclassified Dolichospermum TaxID=2622029 RepID=UPI0014465CB5|nr:MULTISPECIES: TAXI family TRAP transporter solute-binding subunit [unclassified Dolichospermum]MTJ18490.1 TAXI family TRAP transporter solute-binding subunit [Dolichospermum sp. UHCC 0299]MTJ38631.1 TAXI family TRAP transporter solute-binding subunit [Dolichospermum sp. UHCC 0406]
MSTAKNNHQTNFLQFFLVLDPFSRLIFLGLGFASFGTVVIIVGNIVNYLTPPHLTLAAGDKTGESYIISEAIKKVIERRTNIQIQVEETRGTTQNIEMLSTGKAQLAMAQVDVAAEEIGNVSSQLKANIRTVTLLYKDTFQLVVKNPQINQFTQLKGKTIALAATGGQYQSFLTVAKHFGLSEKDFEITGLDSNGKPIPGYNDRFADKDFRENKADAVFRVRAIGNKSIANLVNNHQGKLISIPQAEAMKIKQPAFESAIIPQGAYRGNYPVPNTNLSTVAISRLLLTNDQVDANIIRKLIQTIYENRQEIANEIPLDNAEVKPLISSISPPKENSGVDIFLHPGAAAFYDKDKPSFIQEYADYIGLLLTIFLLAFQWIRQLKLWIEKSKKDEADEYIKSAISLMKAGQYQIGDRQRKLDKTFDEAAKSLIDERISQESFRTFNEAYKNTKEAIERDKQIAQQAIEKIQRENAAKYIKIVVKLLRYGQQNQSTIVQQKLDTILEQVVSDLVLENISQESFRTFIEAYKATRDSIESKNQSLN